MKALIILTILILITGCQSGGGESSPTAPSVDSSPEAPEAPGFVRAEAGAALEVIAYPLAQKYLNGLRDVDGGATIMTRDKWEALCIAQNVTGKTYAYPMASVNLLEMVGPVYEDQDHATYVRDEWLYGIDLDNADILDESSNLISQGLDWLIDATAPVNLDFMPVDSALYLGKKNISAGHHYRSPGQTVGTLLYNAGNVQAQFNTDNNQSVDYFCLAY